MNWLLAYNYFIHPSKTKARIETCLPQEEKAAAPEREKSLVVRRFPFPTRRSPLTTISDEPTHDTPCLFLPRVGNEVHPLRTFQ